MNFARTPFNGLRIKDGFSGNPAATYNDLSLARPFSPAASVTAMFASFGAPEDRLGIRHQGNGAGQIGVSGANMFNAGVPIGIFAGGTELTPLAVSLNPNATVAATQEFLRNLTYLNTSITPITQRKAVRLTLTDGADNATNMAIQHLINSAAARNPNINAIAPLCVIRTATLTRAGSFADVFGSSRTPQGCSWKKCSPSR